MDSVLNSIRPNCTKAYDPTQTTDNGENLDKSDVSPYGHKILEGSASHQSILESHANSATNALIYIGIVLLLYVTGMAFIIIRYVLMKSYCKSQQTNPPYYFGGNTKSRGATTTTATTTMGGTSGSAFPGGGASTCIDGDVTPPEIRFIETEL